MLASIIWFIGLLAIAACCFVAGARLGKRSRQVGQTSLFVLVCLIAVAALPRYRPALAAEYVPLSLLVHLEGTFGVYPWMALVGVLAMSSLSSTLRRAVPLLAIMGLLLFLHGAVWMVLPVIQVTEVEDRSETGVTLQSRHDSCVPSACATAVRRFGISATEAQMCHVVRAKPSRGSTLVRAAWGLRDFLAPHEIDVTLEDLTIEEVAARARRNRPILITVRSSLVADHMIVVLGPYGDDVLIANPSPFGHHGRYRAQHVNVGDGLEVFSMSSMREMYRRGAIVLTPMDKVVRVRE
jgi:hypothetical protein